MPPCFFVRRSLALLSQTFPEFEVPMLPFAHHVAVELFGREFSPRTPLEHVCAFGFVGVILALSVYGAWTLTMKLVGRAKVTDRLTPR
jgi:hypothetical protein